MRVIEAYWLHYLPGRRQSRIPFSGGGGDSRIMHLALKSHERQKKCRVYSRRQPPHTCGGRELHVVGTLNHIPQRGC